MTNCRAKLRHAEYYDFQDIQDKLYADSKAGKEFKHLEELINCHRISSWHIAT